MNATWHVMNAYGEIEFSGTYEECNQELDRMLRETEDGTPVMLYTFGAPQAEFYRMKKTWQLM